jgi:hypothetical protein
MKMTKSPKETLVEFQTNLPKMQKVIPAITDEDFSALGIGGQGGFEGAEDFAGLGIMAQSRGNPFLPHGEA